MLHGKCHHVAMATADVVGREPELAVVEAFLQTPISTPAALVLDGDAGIGKSTLWLAAVHAARDRGSLVLSTRPTEAEHGLAYMGLGDLLDTVLDVVLPALPPPQRRALEVALLREEAAGDLVDPRALGLATRHALQLLGSERSVLVAIDDVQWLDDASSRVLAFALRRLDTFDVRVLLARRIDRGAAPTGPESALADDHVERLFLGPLSVGAVHALLQQRLGRTFARPTLLRLHQTSGGNPFYAIELARTLDRAAADVPVPDSLADLVRRRLGALPMETRAALLVIAALGRPSRAVVAATGVTDRVLAPAVAADVVEVHEDVRFTHPLLASTLYGDAAPDDRRELHGRLASVVQDPIASARHVALGPRVARESVARRLEDAATLARVRGAADVAAELGELAAERTSPGHPDDARRRLLGAARDYVAAAATDRALALTESVLQQADSPLARSEAFTLLSEIHARAGGAGGAVAAARYAREALAESPGDREVRLRAHVVLASVLVQTEGTVPAEAHARGAMKLAEDLGDYSRIARAMSQLAWIRLETGRQDALALAERAVKMARSSRDLASTALTTMTLGEALLSLGRLQAARSILEEYRAWAATNDESELAGICATYVLLELRAGRWAEAADYAQQMRELKSQLNPAGHEVEGGYGRLALVAAYLGDESRARDYARQALENVERGGWSEGRRVVRAIMGLIDLWSGDPLGAVEQLDLVEAERRAAGLAGPTLIYRPGEHVEALLALGRTEAAIGVLERWATDAARVENAWELAEVLRSRGLVAAARGDLDGALALLEQAVQKHQEVGDLFGRARALLSLGVMRRRTRQKRASRAVIEEAVAAFEALGAAGWAVKARAELGRLGGRTREPGLTAAERRVAALVAQGHTNREVSTALFLSERTVETHLSHAYSKLGVRSRAELARTFRAAEQTSGDLTIPS